VSYSSVESDGKVRWIFEDHRMPLALALGDSWISDISDKLNADALSVVSIKNSRSILHTIVKLTLVSG
jgi:hypothetical protein